MPHKICLLVPTRKGKIFELKNKMICFDLNQEKPRLPRAPGPFVHLQSLATIVDLAASLPEKLS